MNAFMYYIRRIDLLGSFAERDTDADNFLEYAKEELWNDIERAAAEMHLTSYQVDKLQIRLDRTI